MRLGSILPLCILCLLSACSDSTDYPVPPDYDYDTAPPEEEKAPATLAPDEMLAIVLAAGDQKPNNPPNKSQTKAIAPPTKAEPTAKPENKEKPSQAQEKPKTVHENKAPVTPVKEKKQVIEKPAEQAKPVVSKKTTTEPPKKQPVIEKQVVASKPAPAESQPPKPSNQGFKELNFQNSESQKKITTVKLENDELTRKGTQSLSIYASTERDRFIKIGKNGTPVDEKSDHWFCIQDKKSGLIWEGKSSGKLRNAKHRYAIEGNSGDCGLKSCNAQDYVDHLNKLKLCGKNNWRLPSRGELLALALERHDDGLPAIDIRFFPNTQSSFYWTSGQFKYAADRGYAVDFTTGFDKSRSKSEASHLRLVSDN